jgi:hypothetical protein
VTQKWARLAPLSVWRSTRPQCGDASRAPRVAFVLAGTPRAFLTSHDLVFSFLKRVVASFQAAPGSHIFLHLKGVTAKVAHRKLPEEMFVNNTMPVLIWGSERELRRLGEAEAQFNEQCFAFSLAKAAPWWSAMWTGLAMVRVQEKLAKARFAMVFFARPDIHYQTDWGPWCSYHPRTWYTGGERVTPDHLWVLPRDHADLVLSTYDVALKCRVGKQCCNVTGAPVSWWVLRYWSGVRGITLSGRVPGYGIVVSSRTQNLSSGPMRGFPVVGMGN